MSDLPDSSSNEISLDEETATLLRRIVALEGDDVGQARVAITDPAEFGEFLRDIGCLDDEVAIRILNRLPNERASVSTVGAKSQRVEKGEVSDSKLRTETLLIVDDEPDFVALTARVLERVGYKTIGAISLEEARRSLNAEGADLLLIDERIGRDSGTRFLDEVRQTHPNLSAVLMSGYSDFQMALRALRSGAADLLPKPIPEDKLVETVRRVLGKSRLAGAASRDTDEPTVSGQSVPVGSSRAASNEAIAIILDLSYADALGEFEDLYFKRLLKRARGNTSRAARLAGIDPTLLSSRLKSGTEEESEPD